MPRCVRNIVLPFFLLVAVATVIAVLLTTSVRPPSHPNGHHKAPSTNNINLVPVAGHVLHEYDLPDVFFSIKSSEIIYPYSRLTPMALTWFRKVPSNNVRSLPGGSHATGELSWLNV